MPAVITFKQDHISMIKQGRKVQTRRTWKDEYARKMKPGTILDVKVNRYSGPVYCQIRLLDLNKERLGDITEPDAHKEGGYTIETYKQAWEEINGAWNPDALVYVVTFEVV